MTLLWTEVTTVTDPPQSLALLPFLPTSPPFSTLIFLWNLSVGNNPSPHPLPECTLSPLVRQQQALPRTLLAPPFRLSLGLCPFLASSWPPFLGCHHKAQGLSRQPWCETPQVQKSVHLQHFLHSLVSPRNRSTQRQHITTPVSPSVFLELFIALFPPA